MTVYISASKFKSNFETFSCV